MAGPRLRALPARIAYGWGPRLLPPVTGTLGAAGRPSIMTELISRFLRAVLFAVLALLGMGMALVFMLSTAVAVAVLYVVARLRGKPFGVRAYWAQRRGAGYGSGPGAAGAGPGPFRRPDVIDVEVREVR